MSSRSLIITSPLTKAVVEQAKSSYSTILPDDENMRPDDVVARSIESAANAILLTSRVPMSAEAVAALPDSVRILATCSVGYDHIDVAACAERSILVTNTPDVLTETTADLAFLHILATARRASEYTALMQAGWGKRLGLDEMLGLDVHDKTLGIVGMGRIGAAVARRAAAFSMNVHYVSRREHPETSQQGWVRHARLDDMLPGLDFLSLHLPGTSGGGPLIGFDELGRLPKGAILVNVARGSLVDEDALNAALASGHLAGAGLDVFASEPDFDTRLLRHPNVFLTPHAGSATLETRDAMGFRALRNIDACLDGRTPPDIVRVG